ncbi:MAG: PDZ domain-containing protein [Helicobacteraceae bacterium]|nr:PDZ domain-containing protein [Helicobacteraceae bacterium]
MKKLIISAFCCVVLNSSIFAYDFSACEKRAQSTMEKVGNTYGVAVKKIDSKEKAALFVYSPKSTPKGYKILKHDPFVGMYLVESKKNLETINIRSINKEMLEDEVASITPKESISGKIAQRMQSPIDFAKLNIPTFKNSIISTICEHAYGIGIGNGEFIEKEYLDRFLNSKTIHYGDIGIRVSQNESGVIVSVIDPFFKDNPFKYNDVILSVNNENIDNLSTFNRIVFDLEKDSTAFVKIRRDGGILEVPVVVDSRRGGMLLAENFLSRVGISINDDFIITSIAKGAKNGFEKLKIGDKVLRVNQENIKKGKNNIIYLLGKYPDQMQSWLISRDDFQFFIEVNEKQNRQKPLNEGLLSETTRFAL